MIVSSLPLYWPRFDVTTYGARADGSDDTASIQQAINAAVENGQGIIYFPAGTYRVTPQSLELWKQYPVIFYLTTGNLIFLGEPNLTHIFGYMPGLLNPVSTWNIPQTSECTMPVSRFGMFRIDSNKGPISNIQFRYLDINGQAGYTGNHTVLGDPATGDGWDLTHKALALDGANLIDDILIYGCVLRNWRGEIIYSGGDRIRKLSVVNTRVYSTNASSISCSGDVLLDRVIVGSRSSHGDVYNGVENFALGYPQKTIIRNSTIGCSSNPDRHIHGNAVVYIGLPSSRLVLENSKIERSQFGLLLSETAHNCMVRRNEFSRNVHGAITSILAQYPKYGMGFSRVTIRDNTYRDSGSVLVNQAGELRNLIVERNTVFNGTLLQGIWQWSCGSPTIDGNTLAEGSQDVTGNYAGGDRDELIPMWTNTKRIEGAASARTRIDAADGDTTTIAPWTDLVVLNSHSTAGTHYVELDETRIHLYRDGFTITFLPGEAKDWSLRANPAWNTLQKDQPVSAKGTTLKMNAYGKFELVTSVSAASVSSMTGGFVPIHSRS